MVDVARILAFQYPSAAPNRDYRVTDRRDGQGPIITDWNAALGIQPTLTELETIEASAAFQTWKTRDLAPERTSLDEKADAFLVKCDQFLSVGPTPSPAQVRDATIELVKAMKAIVPRLRQLRSLT